MKYQRQMTMTRTPGRLLIGLVIGVAMILTVFMMPAPVSRRRLPDTLLKKTASQNMTDEIIKERLRALDSDLPLILDVMCAGENLTKPKRVLKDKVKILFSHENELDIRKENYDRSHDRRADVDTSAAWVQSQIESLRENLQKWRTKKKSKDTINGIRRWEKLIASWSHASIQNQDELKSFRAMVLKRQLKRYEEDLKTLMNNSKDLMTKRFANFKKNSKYDPTAFTLADNQYWLELETKLNPYSCGPSDFILHHLDTIKNELDSYQEEAIKSMRTHGDDAKQTHAQWQIWSALKQEYFVWREILAVRFVTDEQTLKKARTFIVTITSILLQADDKLYDNKGGKVKFNGQFSKLNGLEDMLHMESSDRFNTKLQDHTHFPVKEQESSHDHLQKLLNLGIVHSPTFRMHFRDWLIPNQIKQPTDTVHCKNEQRQRQRNLQDRLVKQSSPPSVELQEAGRQTTPCHKRNVPSRHSTLTQISGMEREEENYPEVGDSDD